MVGGENGVGDKPTGEIDAQLGFLLVVIDGDDSFVSALLGGNGHPAVLVEPGGEDTAAFLQREAEDLLGVGDETQGGAAGVIDQGGGVVALHHGMLHGDSLVQIDGAVSAIEPDAVGGADQQTAVQRGEAARSAAVILEGLGLTGVAAGDAAVGEPAPQAVQIEFIPVCHQKDGAQHHGHGDQEGQKAEKGVGRFFRRLFFGFQQFHKRLR